MQKSEINYNMIDWWKKAMFDNYANFKGRARRSEYWYFVLGQFILIIPFYVLAVWASLSYNETLATIGIAGYMIVVLATFVPALAVTVRRLHDTGRSGWYYFIGLIPLIGAILLLVWFFTEGNRFSNNWGDDPKDPNGGLQFDFEQSSSN